jgi:beta-phosphoglucomutase-like phosphatase (HAD superfamily)
VVEDVPAGVRAGKMAGARVIAFTTTVEAVNLRQAGADWVLSSCADVRLLSQDKGLTLGLNAE